MKKIVQVLLICLIIAGIIVISTVGFNVGLKYSEHIEISINVGSQFNVADIKAITKEVFGNSNKGADSPRPTRKSRPSY